VKQGPRREVVGVDPVTEAILRGGVALGLVAVALIHFLDLFSKLDETPYLGVAYVGLIAASLVVAGQLVTARRPGSWLVAAGLAGITICGYVLSRAVGLPNATSDIGNWKEPLGLASLFVEALVLTVSVYAISRSALGLRPPKHLATAQDR
jgi:hypothetical protein